MIKKITFTLLISSVLVFSGLAQADDYWTAQKGKKKQPEHPVENEKKKDEGRGGDKKNEDGKKGKKP